MLLFAGTMALGQTKTVTGRVTDDQGNPVPFASVKVQGTRVGASADADGRFSIKAAEGATLVISATDMKEQTSKVGSGNTVSVSMERSSSTQIKDVVVTTALGVKKQAKELGYATTRVTNDELTKAKPVNIGAGLSGKVAGLSISQPNSGVGNDVRVVLRGNRSLAGNNQPILVVDGAIVSIGFLNSINPNDVETLNILKGAGATALYGNEAANGAIIITTKRGSRGKAIIKVSSTINVEQVSLMPKLQNEFGSNGGESYFDIYGNRDYVPYENQSFGPRYDGRMVQLGSPVRLFNPDGSYRDTAWIVPYVARPNEKRKFFADAYTYQNDISFSSGDEKGMIYVSAQDVKRFGTVPDDLGRRTSARVNGSRDMGKVNVDFSVGYTKGFTDEVGPDVQQDRSVYWSVLNTPSFVPLTQLKDTKNNPFATPSGYFNAYYGNPYWTIHNSRQKSWSDDVIANLGLSYKPFSWLTASYRVAYNASFGNFEYFRKGLKYESWARDFAEHGWGDYTDVAGLNSGGYKTSSYPGFNPQGFRQKSNSQRLQGDFLLTFDKKITEDFNLRASVGNSIYEISSYVDEVGRDANLAINEYDDVGVWGPNYALGSPLSYHTESKRRTIGLFGEATLGFRNYLFLHGSFRNDWDSRLEKGKRSFNYPAGDLSFVFTEAIPALKNNKILTSGKLRLSLAKVGLLQVGAYSTRNIYAPPAGFPFGDIVGYSVGGQFNNPNLTPEFTTEKELGLELAWFKSRLLTDISIFQQNATNQTLPVGISAATGRPTALKNVGEVENKGIELDVRGTIISNKNVRWTVGVNYSYLDNRVLDIAPGVNELPLQTIGGIGGGVYAIVGQRYPIIKTTDWDRDSLGRIIVNPITGLPTRNATAKSYGSSQPLHRLGINSSVSWKGFTLYALAEYRGGGIILNAVGADLDFTGTSYNSVKFNREKFVIPNSVYKDATGKYVPNTSIVIDQDPWNFFGNLYNSVGSNYITSANFWKLREVSLSYDLPKRIVNKTKVLKAVNITLVGRDLLILTPKENVWTDPEFSNTTGNSQGITNNLQTPSTRKFGVSLNLTF